jgi:hypothetical protein
MKKWSLIEGRSYHDKTAPPFKALNDPQHYYLRFSE